MTLLDEIEALERRLSRAESDRDTWRAAGMQEKYEQAYFLVESIQCQLDACHRQRAAERPPG